MAPISRAVVPYTDNDDEETLLAAIDDHGDIEKGDVKDGAADTIQEAMMDDDSSIVMEDDEKANFSGPATYSNRLWDAWRVRWRIVALVVVSLGLLSIVKGTINWTGKVCGLPATKKGVVIHSTPEYALETSHVFSGGNFSLAQALEWPHGDYSYTHQPVVLTGKVQVRETADRLPGAVKVDLKMRVSDLALTHLARANRTDGQLDITVPAMVRSSDVGSRRAYIDVQATIYIKRGTALERLRIESEFLATHFLSDARAPSWTAESIFVKSDSGNVSMPAEQPLASSRVVTIITANGNIDGAFDLLDGLYLGSEHGNIHVRVHPQPADPAKPKRATFFAGTDSGNIDVDMLGGRVGPEDIPPREYMVRVAGGSGSVAGRYLLGHETHLETESGSISATMLPVSPLDTQSTFTTSTDTGSTDIHVLSPLQTNNNDDDDDDDDGSKGKMQWTGCYHVTNSGSMKLKYPSEWEGRIGGKTYSGRIDVHGQDLEIIRRTPNTFEARRGHGHRSLVLDSYDGSVDVDMG